MKTVLSWMTVTLAMVLISACAAVGSSGGGAGEMEIRSGKIEQITLTQMQTNHDSGDRAWHRARCRHGCRRARRCRRR
jgi:outer membrane lipoprotein SlyB